MAWENRRYTIFNVSETGSFDWDTVLDNPALCTTNTTGSYVLAKWDGDMPGAVQSLTTRVTASADRDNTMITGSGISGSFIWSEIQSVLDTPGFWIHNEATSSASEE